MKTSIALALAVLNAPPPPALEFDELSIHLEVDLPADDPRFSVELPAELVVEASAPRPLAALRVTGPDGRAVLAVDGPDARSTGLGEIAVECESGRLRDVLRDCPPGDYLVEATTLDGARVAGVARLRSRFPGPFEVVSPARDAVVPAGDVAIEWTASRGAARYVLEVEHEASGFSLEVALPPGRTSFVVPGALLRPGEPYEYSLAVEGDTDNELEIEGRFATPLLGAPHAPSRH